MSTTRLLQTIQTIENPQTKTPTLTPTGKLPDDSPVILEEKKGTKLISDKKVFKLKLDDITNEFKLLLKGKITEIFGEGGVHFAFIFGSFAKGYATFEHDFDVFLCLKERNKDKEKSLITWFVETQIKYGLNPDYDFPLEIMDLKDLEKAIIEAGNFSINLELQSKRVFDFTTWTQILSDTKSIIMGDSVFISELEQRCGKFQEIWKTQLLLKLQQKEPLHFLKKIANFDDHKSYSSRKRAADEWVSTVSRFNLSFEKIRTLAIENNLKTFQEISEFLKKDKDRPVVDTEIKLEVADGDFETYSVVSKEHNQTKSDLRAYIPFETQYNFIESNYDRRQTLLTYVNATGIVPETNSFNIRNIVTGHGTGYILNKFIQILNDQQGHVFVIPTPTYGYFIPSIEACGAHPLFIETTHFSNYTLTPRDLEKNIQKSNDELYKSNINVFILKFKSLIRSFKEKGIFTDEINKFINLSDDKKTYESAKLFKQHIVANKAALEKKYSLSLDPILKEFPALPQVRCLYFVNPHNPLGMIYDQDYVNSIAKIAAKYNLAVIEDLTHMELMYDEESSKKMGFFNKTNIPLDVITLVSPSKSLCMAECRVGFALVSNDALVHAYKEQVFNDGLFLSYKKINALEKAFILNPERQAYISRNATEYLFRKNLVKYIIYGNEKSGLDDNDKEKIISYFKQNKIDPALFEKGMKDITLLNKDIQSGFFGILDLSCFKNKYFINTQIKDNNDLGLLLNIYGMTSLTGNDIYYPRRLVIRLPFCIDPLLLIETFRRINMIAQNVSPKPLLMEEMKATSMEVQPSHHQASITKMDQPFSLVRMACDALLNHIKQNYESIIGILTEYESYMVAEDEVQRAIDCLSTVDVNKSYFASTGFNQGASFLPLNLPLYSVILFGVMPSFQTSKIYLKPPQTSIDIYQKVYDILKIDDFFKNIQLKCIDRELFLEEYVYPSDVILFTGKHENALKILRKAKKEALFIFNGAGHNPLVITNDADMELAVNKTVHVKTYNNGQDCAGPDSILVQSDVYPEFIKALTKELSSVPIGSYKDHKNVIGRLTEAQHISKIAEFLAKHSANIVYGGTIDFRNATVHPTIIVTNINDTNNYEELFAPILFITTYSTDDELAIYFGNSKYEKNEMYISLFGNSKYVESLEKSIILKNKIIHDIEKGNEEFGGYGSGASFVSCNGERVCKPILVPREISERLLLAPVKEQKTGGAEKKADHEAVKSKKQKTTHKEAKEQKHVAKDSTSSKKQHRDAQVKYYPRLSVVAPPPPASLPKDERSVQSSSDCTLS